MCSFALNPALAQECLLSGSSLEVNTANLSAITFGSERFVAVGDSGMIVVSTNITNWVRQQTPISSRLNGVTYGEGRFVAVGNAGCVLWSTNGSQWSLVNVGATNTLNRIAFGKGHFLTLDTDRSTLWRSVDAMTWEPSTNGLPNFGLFGLYFGGGLFVGCGRGGTLYVSSDGLNWTNASVPTWSTFNSGAYGNGVFVTAGYGEFGADQVARSTNGLFWTSSRHSMNYNAFCFGGGFLVGVGGNAGVQWSSDGLTWTNAYIGSVSPLGVAYGAGYYVVVGESGKIFTTTNLFTWTARNQAVCPINTIISGNGVIVGISGNCGMIYSSEDGIHFIQRRSCGGVLTAIGFANGLFVTAGNVGILTSSDGTNWTPVPSPSIGGLPSLRYEQGVWVAAYQGIISSADGTNWILRVANPGYLTGLTYGNSRWVAFGWSGAIWSSPDGTNWVNCSTSTITDWGPIAIQDGLFSLYGSRGFIIPPSAVVSRDGVQWFDPAKSGPLLDLQRDSAENLLRLALAGEWGRVYGLQASTNLSLWSDSGMLTNSGGVTSLTLTNAGTNPAFFVRAVAN